MNTDKPFLTIGIPTYNRAEKINRLLGILKKQIVEEGLSDLIEVFISDNCSTDDTNSVLKNHSVSNLNINHFVQKNNVGFDLNVLSVYSKTQGEYLWLLADDDIPKDGTLTKIVAGLKSFAPSVLLFSFGQPPGSKQGVFNFKEPVYLSNDMEEAVEFVMRWPKISVYVLKRIDLSNQDNNIIDNHTGDGWNHVVLALTILNSCPKNGVLILSEILAHCDDDFDMLAWTPDAIMKYYRLALHPLVSRVNPLILKQLLLSSYFNSIQFCFAAKVGSLRVLDMEAYDRFIHDLPWKINYLIKKPKSLAQFLLLKLNLAHFYSSRNQTKQTIQ